MEGFSELRKLLVAVNPIHSPKGFQQAESEPSGPLLRMMPAFYPPDVILNQAVEVLDRIGAFERSTYLLENAEPVEGQGLLQSFLKGAGRRPINLLELPVEFLQSRLRLLIRWLIRWILVGMPKLPSPFSAIGFWQMSDNVFPPRATGSAE